MTDQRLVINVEEQIAVRLHERGFPDLARNAVAHSQSLAPGTPLSKLKSSRLVPLTPEEEAARKESAAASAIDNLRADRDALLAASDWTQLPDAPAENQKAWAAYRKKLRDLPAKTKDPTNITWPAPPT